MASKRKAIRDAIAALIAEKYIGDVFTTPNIDARNISECFRVFFADGNYTSDGEQEQRRAEVIVAYTNFTVTDQDHLDLHGDIVADHIDQNPQLGGLVWGLEPTGFAYPQDETGTNTELQLTYLVTYQEG